MLRTTGAFVGAALAAGGLLAGCGGSTKTVTETAAAPASATAPAPASTAAAAATTTAASPPTTTTAASATGGATAPGTKLSVGQTATVPYNPPSKQSQSFRLKVTVESIKKGSLSDFNGIKLDATQKASIPYYVKVRIANASPGDAGAADNPSVQIEGVDGTGQTQQSVTFFGDFPPCNDVSAPKPLSQGKSFETCLVFLIPGGIKAAAYTGATSYIDKPVTWATG